MKIGFDGTFQGLLSVIFQYFLRRWQLPVELDWAANPQGGLFGELTDVPTDLEHAERVLKGLAGFLPKEEIRVLYAAFLSENQEVQAAILRVVVRLFTEKKGDFLQNFGDADVLLIQQTARKVEREKHRMMAFIRFKKSSDGTFYALIEPDYNVLPLLATFFQKRYADQPWHIFDARRQYGLLYNGVEVTETYLSTPEHTDLNKPVIAVAMDEQEEHFQDLWKAYFKSTNIPARKNLKLHLQHVPRRYWKYLIEKH